jgi:hypothetical protein
MEASMRGDGSFKLATKHFLLNQQRAGAGGREHGRRRRGEGAKASASRKHGHPLVAGSFAVSGHIAPVAPPRRQLWRIWECERCGAGCLAPYERVSMIDLHDAGTSRAAALKYGGTNPDRNRGPFVKFRSDIFLNPLV